MLNKVGSFPAKLPDAIEGQAPKKTEGQENDFMDTLKGFMSEVNQLQKEAGEKINQLASGDINNVHDVMVAVEKASVSFELMMEIRNKVIEAYHEVMRMQV